MGKLSRAVLLFLAGGGCVSLAACTHSHAPEGARSGMLLQSGPGGAAPVSGPPRLAKVELFGNGVGYFEYDGFVHNNATETLYFRSGQMADVTKSLTLQDFGGGRVSEAVLHSRQPLAVRLAKLPLDLYGSPSMISILEQLTGVKITLTLRGSKRARRRVVTGRLINVHHVSRSGPAPIAVTAVQSGTKETLVANLYRHGSVTTIPVSAITKLHIDNRKLRKAFHIAFHAITHQPSRHRRPLTLLFRGHGRRQVRFGYLQETPLWRMSYRLILQRGTAVHARRGQTARIAGAAPAKTTATLEALAIVHNQSNLNWNDVRLHLIGRMPVSFIENLDAPLYSPRGIVGLPFGADLSPQTYRHKDGWGYSASSGYVPGSVNNGGLGNGSAQQQGSLFQTNGGAAARQSKAAFDSGKYNLQRYTMSQGIASAATAGAVRPAFNYRIPDVSIAKRRSAEVVVLAAPVRVKRIDIFQPDLASTHPMLAARLINTSGKYLQAGPVTVFSNGDYAGDGQLPSLGRHGKNNIQFALDQQVTVKSLTSRQTSRLLSTTLEHGLLTVRKMVHQTTGYRIRNRSNRKKRLLIERPPMDPWKLLAPARLVKIKPRKGQLHWWETLAPNAVHKVTLQRQEPGVSNTALTADTRRQLLKVARQHKLPPAIRRAIVRAAALRRTEDIQKSRLKTLDARYIIIRSAELRARHNLAAVKKLKKVDVTALIAPLATTQKQLTALQISLSAQENAINKARARLTRYWRRTRVKVLAHK